jgi:hypothetical protein
MGFLNSSLQRAGTASEGNTLAKQSASHGAVQADGLSRDLSETMPQHGLLKRDDHASMALRTAGLDQHLASLSLRGPGALLQGHNSPAAALHRRFHRQRPTPGQTPATKAPPPPAPPPAEPLGLGALLLQLRQLQSFLAFMPQYCSSSAAVLRLPGKAGQLRHVEGAVNLCARLAPRDQLYDGLQLSRSHGLELADDLLRYVPFAFLLDSLAQPGWLRSHAHPGLTHRVHVRMAGHLAF